MRKTMERNYYKPSWRVKRLFKQTLFQSKINIRNVLKTWAKSLSSVIVKLLELLHGCFPNISKNIYIFEHPLKSLHPTNTPRVFHVETTWKRSFLRHLNVEYTRCVCRARVWVHEKFAILNRELIIQNYHFK